MGLLNKCVNCGCEDDFLRTPPPCPTAVACPTEVCSNIQYAECTVYTGDIITCSGNTVVPSDTNMAAAINDIASYFCSAVQTLQNAQGLFDTGFRVSLNPTITLNTVTASLTNSNISNGTVIIFPTGDLEYQIVDGTTTTQYNTSTGIWTCPQTGKYDINYGVNLTCPDQTGFGWGNTASTGGTYSIGATSTGGGTTVYCSDTFTITKGLYYTKIYLTGGIQGKVFTAGDQVVLRHQNMTGINYTGVSGDNIDWSIRRVG